MVMLDTLSNALNELTNADRRAKKEVIISPASRLIIQTMRLLQSEGYIGEIEYIDDGRQGKLKIQLLGRINKAAAIKPRYSLKVSELSALPEWLKKKLPSREIGILIISTSKGIMSHHQTIKENTGGILLGYVY
ncbi:30S ribosomal protein S8 [Fervidicoccus fontis]|uniref:Small ribosomal subunit protein uS8 n=1 Tax=Fervidicoccus fontis TaxID=683846 RepID=A0A7C2ZRB3_9CREN|nr:30S ribosomal protein S8 [Fervidicoccus fontis]